MNHSMQHRNPQSTGMALLLCALLASSLPIFFRYRKSGNVKARHLGAALRIAATAVAAVTRIEPGEPRGFDEDAVKATLTRILAAGVGAKGRPPGLLRWRHPERGLIPPEEFVLPAEETHLIVHIGEWVLEEARRQARALRREGRSLRLSVNRSGRQLVQRDLIEKVDAILSATGFSSANLKLELTESMVMRHPENAAGLLKSLKERGIGIAVDDFGTGYTSLNYLKRFPIDTLMVDKSFIRDIHHEPNTAAITETIVALGRTLKMEVVAEGVETIDQLRFLRRMGCHTGQGFFFGPPLPPERLPALLRRPNPHVFPVGRGKD